MASPNSVIGVWTSAYRQKVQVRDDFGDNFCAGPYVQVSRLGNPLINEVIIPMGKKDYLEPPGARGRQPVRVLLLEPAAGTAAPGPVPTACSRTWPSTTRGRRHRTGPISWPSSSRGSRRGSSPASRTTPGRHRPTCSASTWPSPRRNEPGQHRSDRQRRRRLPQRPARVRRRGHHRAAGHCRCGAEAGGPGRTPPTPPPVPSARGSPRAPPTYRPWGPRTTCPRSRTSGCPTAASWSRRADGGLGPPPHPYSHASPSPHPRPWGPGAPGPQRRGERRARHRPPRRCAGAVHGRRPVRGGDRDPPRRGDWHGAHTAVRERHVGGRVLYAGVFGSLAAGHLRPSPQRWRAAALSS